MAGPSDATALILQMSADISGMQKQLNAAVGIVDTNSRRMELRSKEAAAAIEKSFGTINVESFGAMLEKTAKLQDQLTAAQAAGNAAEVKSIREQIVLQGQLQKAAAAQLETQLAIAKASGNKAQVAQLTESLALQSQLSKFQSVGLTGAKALHEAEAAVVALGAAERAVEGANVGKALDKVFDSSKLAVLEEGGAKIRVFGSALEPLGPIGIGVAAALVAVGAAAEEARKAMEWADDLDRTAKKLGTTTTSLQALDYASVATSIGLQQGRDALAQFNEKVGAFESHVRDKTMEKFAAGVHLTRQEVSQTVDPVEKLRLVMEKIATLPNAQQRASGAKAFGLDGLLPIINEGSEGIDKFIGKMKEARANGSIVDPQTIAKTAELNDKVEELTYRIGIDFKKAFVDLAPAIESVVGFVQTLTHELSNFLGDIPLVVRGMQDIINLAPHLPKSASAERQNLKPAENAASQFGFPVLGVGDLLSTGLTVAKSVAKTRGQVGQLSDKINAMLAGGKIDLVGTDFDPALANQKPGQQLAFDKPKKGAADETLNFDKAAQDAYDSGLKALIAAQAALTGDMQARAEFEKQAVDADLTKKLDDLAAEEAKIRAAKNDLHKAEQLALIEKAKTEEQNAAAARKELIDRNTAFAIEDRLIELYRSKLDAQIAELTAQGSIATTAKERAAIDLRILVLRQQLERDLHDAQIDRRTHTDTNPGGDLTPEQAARLKGDFNATQDAQASAQRHQIFLDANPIAAYLHSLQDVNKVMQEDGVQAAQDLSQALTDVATGAKSFGQAMLDVFRNLFAKLLEQSIERDVTGPILGGLGSLFGFGGGGAAAAGAPTFDFGVSGLTGAFASGTNFAPGGMALVGEQGPELVNLPRGAQVITANQTLSALKNLSAPAATAGVTIIQPFHFHAEGAVMTDQLLAQANQQAAQYASRAYSNSLRDGRKGLPDALRAHQLLQG